MGNAVGNKPPTPADMRKLYASLGKNYGELTESMKYTAREVMFKEIYYDPKKPSKRIISEMVLMYAYEMYGKGKLSNGGDYPKQLEKGTTAEPAAIEFLARMDGKDYEKNTEMFTNQWFKGIPDIIVRNGKGEVVKVIEVKISLDLPSYIMNCVNTMEATSNVYELFGYLDLLKCKNGEVVHILVDMPENMANIEQKRLMERFKTLELDEDAISERITRVLGNMEYSNVPEELKVFRRSFQLNKFTMKTVKGRVTMAKKWMKNIHEVFSREKTTLYEPSPNEEPDGENNI
jgi:hypothetical protein